MIHLGPLMVTWHGLLTAAGLLGSIYVARYYARRFGLDAEIIWQLAPYVALAAIAGARLAYVGAHLGEFRNAPFEVLRIDRGGLASFGAWLGGLAALAGFARARGLPFGRLADAVAVAVPINTLFMRAGSFLIGELYGTRTSLPWGVTIPGIPGARHPVPLYDVLAQVLLIAVLVQLARAIPYEGFLFWWTLFAASVIRFAMDLFRPEWRLVGMLTLGQIGALVLLAVSGAAMMAGLRRRQSAGEINVSTP